MQGGAPSNVRSSTKQGEEHSQEAQQLTQQVLQQPCPGEGLAVRVGATIAQARDFMRQWPPSSLEDWVQTVSGFLDSWEGDRAQAQQGLVKAKQDSWDEWQEKTLEGGPGPCIV